MVLVQEVKVLKVKLLAIGLSVTFVFLLIALYKDFTLAFIAWVT